MSDYLSSEQMLHILQVACDEYGTREHCMFLLAAMHGLRASEIAMLQVSDVQDGRIDVRRLKDSLHTVQPLQTHTNPLLDRARCARSMAGRARRWRRLCVPIHLASGLRDVAPPGVSALRSYRDPCRHPARPA